MKAVIYARFSSEKQNEASIEGQLRECLEYAEYNKLEVIGNYIDRACSARTANRPDFQRMIKDSYKHNFDCVIVWKLDRFARDRYDSAYYKNILKKNGVRVISAKETITEGASGILLESILEGYAEFYSAELAEKVKRGMTDNALKGKANGVKAPFGYYVDKDDRFQINETLAPIVKEVYEMYLDGKKSSEIVKTLNARGIKNNGYSINYNVVYRILTNRKYIGEYKFGDVLIPNAIPALIDEETFNKVQERIAVNKKAPAMHRSEDDYLLTTKLHCGKCGALMPGEIGTGRKDIKYRYYKCVRSRKKQCDKKPVKKEWLENLVIEQILELLADDKVLIDLADRIYEMQGEESGTVKSLEAQLNDTNKKLNNMVTAMSQGIFSETTKKFLDELEEQKQSLEIELLEEKTKHPIIPKDQILFTLQNFKKIDTSTKEGKQKLIDSFVNSIYLYDDKFVITFNYKGESKTVTLDDINNSSLTSMGSPSRHTQKERTKLRRVCLFYAKQG